MSEGPNAQEMYNSMVRSDVAPMLRSHGWKGSGKDYKHSSELYRAFINFQKNRWNTKDEVEFTVNLGVLSDEASAQRNAARLEALDRWGRDIVVIPTWGQWGMRIGHLLPSQADKWWRILSGRSPEPIVTELLEALSQYVLPAIGRQMEKPRVEPSAIIERAGQMTGQHFLANGDIRWHNVGGERLYPTDALLELVDRNYIPPRREPTPQIPADINAVHPDGCVSLESELTKRFLAAEAIELSDGMRIMVIQSWIDAKGRILRTPLSGEARYNTAWGWGAEVSPRSLREIAEGIARTQEAG